MLGMAGAMLKAPCLQMFEVEAMTRVKSWLPCDSIVTVPKIHKFDEKNYVVIMEDCGEDALTLKDLVRRGRVSVDLAAELGKSIGHFLGSLHVWGRENPDVLTLFQGNEQAVKMSSWVTYGRLVSTLNGEAGLVVLSDPPIIMSESESQIIAKVASDMQIAMNSAREFVSNFLACKSVTAQAIVQIVCDGRLLAGEHHGCLGSKRYEPA
jgi:hypothetical protein